MLRGRLPVYLLIGLVVTVALWGVLRGGTGGGDAGQNKVLGARFTVPVANQTPPRGAVD